MSRHFDNCQAPICALDKNPNFKKEVIWYPGEIVCKYKPLQKFQKKQNNINNLLTIGKFRFKDTAYTVIRLEK